MQYSTTIQFLLFAAWAIGSLLLSWLVHRRFYVYFGSVAFAVPAISYAMLGPGSMESGGIVQALCAGIYPLPFHYFFQRYRAYRKQKKEAP